MNGEWSEKYMLMKFSKMHGLGNDFVVIDAVTQNVRVSRAMVKRIADRHTGVGCDQVLVIEPPNDHNVDFNYRIFNQDGAEVEQCGNGARCLARFIRDKKLSGKPEIHVKTMNRVISLKINRDNSVSVNMGVPLLEPSKIPIIAEARDLSYVIDLEDQSVEVSAVSMGNPHAIVFVDDTDTAPVKDMGSQLESHGRFPKKVNVGFAQVLNRNHLKLRVYERGVGETKACGSGACAAAVAAIQQSLVDSPVTVELQGGSLSIDWSGEGQSLMMSGPAVTSFHGRIKI
jgi:diaminopimelate epimerase